MQLNTDKQTEIKNQLLDIKEEAQENIYIDTRVAIAAGAVSLLGIIASHLSGNPIFAVIGLISAAVSISSILDIIANFLNIKTIDNKLNGNEYAT